MNCPACDNYGYLPPQLAGMIPPNTAVVTYDPCPCKSSSEVLYGQLIEFKTVKKDEPIEPHSEAATGS